MHLAFSVAFSLFIFAEYIRYFALYPFGASLHIFLSEFLDEKDKGSAILSHFYLLIGCAGVIWLERYAVICILWRSAEMGTRAHCGGSSPTALTCALTTVPRVYSILPA